MRKSLPVAFCSFLAGALIAGLGVFYFMAKESGESAMLWVFGDSARAHARAMQAYQHENPDVAVWELRHLVEVLSDHLEHGVEGPRSMRLQLFLAHGRLARLYQKMGDLENAQQCAEEAIAYNRRYSPTNHVATNIVSVLNLIQEFDKRAKVEPRYE